MLIVDEIKSLASRVGVTATGNTIQDVVLSFKAGLDAKEKKSSAAAAPASDISNEPIIKPRRDKKKKAEAE